MSARQPSPGASHGGIVLDRQPAESSPARRAARETCLSIAFDEEGMVPRGTLFTGSSEEWSAWAPSMSVVSVASGGSPKPHRLAGGVCPSCLDSTVREENRFETALPLLCAECEKTQRVGTVVYGCDHCSRILCGQCHLKQELDDEMIMLTMMQLGEDSLSSSPPSALHVPEEPRAAGGRQTLAVPGLPAASVAARSPAPQKDGRQAGSVGSESTAPDAAVHPLSEIPSPRSQSGLDEEAEAERSESRDAVPQMTRSSSLKKWCSLCASSFEGFGSSCPSCRSRGSRPRKCQRCSDFFQGFGDTCLECRGQLGVLAQPSNWPAAQTAQ